MSPLIDFAVARSHVTSSSGAPLPLIESASRARTFAPFTVTSPLTLVTRSSLAFDTPLTFALPDTVFTRVAPGVATAVTSPLIVSAPHLALDVRSP